VAREPEEGRLEKTKSFKMLLPGTVISHYKIIEKIGEGGMGVVYKATDTRLDRTVALKFLPPGLLCDSDAKARFEHEAKAASALNHPSIATIYEIDEAEGRCFIAMEFLEGGSLKGLLKTRDLSLKEILDLVIQIGEGLNVAHESGVTHRDMKPDNIMLTRKGLAKIMDFGLAKLKGATRLTREGTTLGTLRYMSPEQVRGRGVDARSDLFSLGVVLYEMITGHLPFGGEDEAAVMNSILNVGPEPLARYKTDVSEGLQRIVDKALAKEKEERYQHADEVVADLKRERHISDGGESTAATQVVTSPGPKKHTLRLGGILGAIAVMIILYFIFQPFRIDMGPDRAAIAQENSLAIMYFENMVDPDDTDKTGQMVTALLITDLSESEYMRILSRQRLYDILVRLGKDDQKVIDKSVASRVAAEAGVKWILTGTVLQVEPHIVLTSEISEAETGEILATQRVAGDRGEDLFAVIDGLTGEIRKDMSLPEEAQTEEDRPIAEVTTHSEEAYRHFLEGVVLSDKYYTDEAEVSFRRAVEHDSTFAMALYFLATLTVGEESRELADKALKYSANASEIERYYIESYHAFIAYDYDETIRKLQRILDRWPDEKITHFTMAVIYSQMLGKPELAIHHCRRTLEIDPLFKRAYNQMAYAYERLGDSDSSLWAINSYIDLAPDEPNPYDTRGDLYSYSGRLEEALASYKRADEIKPGFSTLKIGHMHLFAGRYAQAESCYKVMASASDRWDRSEARTYLAIVPLYQGKFGEALKVLDRAIGADQMEQTVRRQNADKRRLAANIHLALEAYETAVEEALNSRDVLIRAYPDNPVFIVDFYAHVLARTGRIAEAEEVLRDLESRMDKEALNRSHTYWVIKGNIARAKGDMDEAVGYFEKGLEIAPDPYFHIRSMLGEAYLEGGRLDQAVAALERALLRYDAARALVPIRAVKAHYSLGLAYEKSGWLSKASEQYETFLDIWKEADDPGIPAVEDARQRLARLKGGA
jgi:serine/threonine protein kinase/tetratricopeptide (TPR) repeat protein